MNMVRMRRGRIAKTRFGAIELYRDPLAPNAVDVGETVVVSDDGDVGITIPAINPAWAKLEIVWVGTNAQGIRRQHTFRVPLSTGSRSLGTIAEVQGPLAGFGPKYAMRATDTSGRIGYPGAFQEAESGSISEDAPVVDSVQITAPNGGLGTVGAAHVVEYSASGNPTVTITWLLDDVGITGYISQPASTGHTYVPVSADDGKSLTVRVEASNSYGSAESTSAPVAIVELTVPVIDTVTISGTGQVGSPLVASVAMTNAGKPVAAITIVWKKGGVAIPGATGASYTPVADDNGATITATATATNTAGSDSETSSGVVVTTGGSAVSPTIVFASITGGNAAGSTHGVSIDVTGTEPIGYTYQWKLGGVNAGTGATYVSPADSTANLTVVITPSNSAGTGSPYTTAAVALVRVAPPQLTPGQWSFTTSNPRPGVTRLETVSIPSSLGAIDVDWTNTARATDQEAVDAGEFEMTEFVETVGGVSTYRVLDVFKSGFGSRNFREYEPSVYPGDTDRAGRLALRYQGASGLFSVRSAVKQISLTGTDPNLPVVYGDWLPIHHRSKEQYIGGGTEANPQPGPAGGGYQFQRSYGYSAADPDYIIAGQDISIIQHTKDFGGWWEHPPLNGMKVGQSAQSLWVDPENADRILALYSAAFTRGNATTTNGWDQHSGMYLSTDRARTWTLVDPIKGLGGSASNDKGETNVRYMQHCICHVPGGTPTTREIWAIVHIMHKGATTTNSLIRRSTNGGQTWSSQGTLSAATYELPLALKRAANGHWWLCTTRGLFKSTTNPAGTWVDICGTTNLARGYIYDADVDGATNEVWAAVGPSKGGAYNASNHGVWKTTTGGTGATSWTKVKDYNIRAMCISPHNRNIILIAGNNGITPQRSTNGGGAWSNISTQKFPGQPEGFQSLIHDTHAHFIWHKADANKVFAARFQHHGVSTNAGATFYWSSANFDYNHLHDFNCDPADWRTVLMAVTDRVQMFTNTAHNYVFDDGMDAAKKDEINAATGQANHLGNGRGALILRNGSHRAYMGALGNTTNGIQTVGLFRSSAKTESDGTINPIGTTTVLPSTQYYGVQWGNYGINDPTNNARGTIGRTRIVLNSNGTITTGDMGKEVIGVDVQGRFYGIQKGAGDRTVYRTSNPFAATPTWAAWGTFGQEPRPIDNDPRGISWDPTSINGKILAACLNRVELIENGTMRVVAVVADLVPGAWPVNQPYSTALDPNSNAAYISLHRYGGPVVFKTDNINVASPVWYDITGDYCPKCPGKLFIHPKTGDLIYSYHSGSFIWPAHEKQVDASYYDAQADVIFQYQL